MHCSTLSRKVLVALHLDRLTVAVALILIATPCSAFAQRDRDREEPGYGARQREKEQDEEKRSEELSQYLRRLERILAERKARDAVIRAMLPTGNDNLFWRLDREGEYFRLIPKIKNTALDAGAANNNVYINANLAPNNWHLWRLDLQQDGSVRFVPKNNNKVALDSAGGKGKPYLSNIASHNENQLFWVIGTDDGFYVIRPKSKPATALDANGGGNFYWRDDDRYVEKLKMAFMAMSDTDYKASAKYCATQTVVAGGAKVLSGKSKEAIQKMADVFREDKKCQDWLFEYFRRHEVAKEKAKQDAESRDRHEKQEFDRMDRSNYEAEAYEAYSRTG